MNTTGLLRLHNEYRAKHQAPPLVLDAECGRLAQAYAEELLAKGVLQHGMRTTASGERLGQNLAMSSRTNWDPLSATTLWYNEVSKYNFNQPGFSSACGHFSQLVWKGTQKVGFGYASKNGRTIVVANYYPAGNVINRFAENVLRAR